MRPQRQTKEIKFNFKKHEKKSKLLLGLLVKKQALALYVAAGGFATFMATKEPDVYTSDTAIVLQEKSSQRDKNSNHYNEEIIEEEEEYDSKTPINEFIEVPDKVIEDNLIEQEQGKDNENLDVIFDSINSAYYVDLEVTSDYGWGTFTASLDLDEDGLGREDLFDNGGGTFETNTSNILLSNIVHSNNITLPSVNKVSAEESEQPLYDLGMTYSQDLNMCKITEDSYNSRFLYKQNCVAPALIYSPIRNLSPTSFTIETVSDGIATYYADITGLQSLTTIAFAAQNDQGFGSVESEIFKVDTRNTLSTDDDTIINATYKYTHSKFTTEQIDLSVDYSNWLYR